jgi:hypothetical protein
MTEVQSYFPHVHWSAYFKNQKRLSYTLFLFFTGVGIPLFPASYKYMIKVSMGCVFEVYELIRINI